jgi:Zn-finger nucleic acid-binding protein
MQCPVCTVPLALSERQGVEIDYCPRCRGVWLDRGELDKLIERVASEGAYPGPGPQRGDDDQDRERSLLEGLGRRHPGEHRRRRRRGFLDDLFDFD